MEEQPEKSGILQLCFKYSKDRLSAVWANLNTGYLWQRMLRNCIATTLTVGISLVNYNATPPFGKAAYLAAMITVFAHPGRRVGQLIESLVLALLGGFVGVGWTLLGLYLSSLMIYTNVEAAYTVRGVFLAIALMFHGFIRSNAPRMFLFVLLFIIQGITGLVSSSKEVTATVVESLVYPMLLAAGVILVVNIFVFPEFSSAFIGSTTISALDTVSTSLAQAGHYFVTAPGLEKVDTKAKADGEKVVEGETIEKQQSKSSAKQSSQPKEPRLGDITATKAKLRKALAACRSAQNESQYEVAFAHIPPYSLSPISKRTMKRLVMHTIAVVGTCETRFALLGDPIKKSKSKTKKDIPPHRLVETVNESAKVDLELLKPQREIEFGDVKLLRYLLNRIKAPYLEFQASLTSSITVITACLAYCYDVSKLPSKTGAPAGVTAEELDIHLASLWEAISKFDVDSTAALEGAAMLQELNNEELDVMPREEIFLIASFLLNMRQAAMQISEMLTYSRELVVLRAEYTGWRRLYLPKIAWRKWLYSGGEEEESVPAKSRQGAKKGKAHQRKEPSDNDGKGSLLKNKKNSDLERGANTSTSPDPGAHGGSSAKKYHKKPLLARLRWRAAEVLEWMQHSEDVSYAFKLTVAAYLVTFPAVVPSLHSFYTQYRGTWAALQLVFVFDVAIGTSVNSFILRACGTTLGSLWGWAAYEARGGNPFVCTAMLFIGLVPCTYVALGSQYPKAGQVAIVSMCVVALATELQTIPGSGTENFLNRWIAFLIGGFVALLVELILLPVKARTRMVDALATATQRIGQMEEYIAFGIEDREALEDGFPPEVFKGFEGASGKAKAALTSAETFLPFCSVEPRLKGSFSGLANIYKEIIFVLRQIVDKMDNMLQLRRSFGSGPLEELNAEIFAYRRNVAGSIIVIIYAIHEALVTKFPLPQFLPSARLAHLRIINKIRDVVHQKAETDGGMGDIAEKARQRTLRQKYMAHNASSAAQAEVIEYLEELVDLTKLLVGSSEFRSGLLTRPTLQQYAANAMDGLVDEEDGGFGEEARETVSALKPQKSNTKMKEEDTDIPVSLQRIQSRKQEAGLKKRRTQEELWRAEDT